MTLGDWIAVVADAVAVLAVATAFWIYFLQQAALRTGDLEAAIKLLDGAQKGLATWGDKYFNVAYDLGAAQTRAEDDRQAVMIRALPGVYVVPTQPVSALIEHGTKMDGVDYRTIEAANMALWQLVVFNQLVQQQADFVTQHAAEIVDTQLPDERRKLLAEVAFQRSWYIHARGIGPATWYSDFSAALDTNIRATKSLKATVSFREEIHRLRKKVQSAREGI